MAKAVRVFKLSGGRGYSVVVGSGPHGSRVTVLGIYATREEADAAARKIKGGRVAHF